MRTQVSEARLAPCIWQIIALALTLECDPRAGQHQAKWISQYHQCALICAQTSLTGSIVLSESRILNDLANLAALTRSTSAQRVSVSLAC